MYMYMYRLFLFCFFVHEIHVECMYMYDAKSVSFGIGAYFCIVCKEPLSRVDR